MAVEEGTRTLSAAPQNHHAPGCAGSDSGRAKWMAESPEALRLPSGEFSSEFKVKPALRQISTSVSCEDLELSSAAMPASLRMRARTDCRFSRLAGPNRSTRLKATCVSKTG